MDTKPDISIHRLLVRALAFAICLLLVTTAAHARPVSEARGIIDRTDDAGDCLQLVPEQPEIPVAGDYETKVPLEVLFLLNQVEHGEALDVVKMIKDIYAPLAIEVIPSYEDVSWDADTTGPASQIPGAENQGSIGSGRLIQMAKDHVGGLRPWGIDVVYVMSRVPLTGSVAGQADCIGGVRWDDAAFAVGEARNQYNYTDEVTRTARIAAHEIAHLMGAHHHYANCAQGDTLALARLYGSICTLMFNDLFFVSGLFSTAEAAAVRGHALAFAADTPHEPPPPHQRSVSLRLKGGLAQGTVTVADDFYPCASNVPVQIEVKTRKGWRTVAEATTSETAWFEAKIGKGPGTYRAVAPEAGPPQGKRGELCAVAISRTRSRN